MKRLITVLLVLAMVATMVPALTFSSAAEEAKIEEGLNADVWYHFADVDKGESGHFESIRRIMGWHGKGNSTSYETNEQFDNSIDIILDQSHEWPTVGDGALGFAEGFGRDAYKAATGNKIGGDNEYLVKWTGTMKATTAGTYTFVANSLDNGVAIFVDGDKAFEWWGPDSYFENKTGNDALLGKYTFEITEAQVGKDIPFEMYFLELAGGEALAMSITADGTLESQKSLADAGFTFALSATYYTYLVNGNVSDLEALMTPGQDRNGNTLGNYTNFCLADNPANNQFSIDQINTIKTTHKKVTSMLLSDMDDDAYQSDRLVLERQAGGMWDSYMMEYTGYLTPSYDGDYQFGASTVDNCFALQLKIDGEWVTVFQLWAKFAFNDRYTMYSADSFELKAGESYELRAYFVEVGGGEPHHIVVKNNDTGVVYNNIDSTMYLTTAPIAEADFTPKAISMDVDGDLSDWEGIKSLSVVGTNEFAGKQATWYGKVTDEGVYLAVEADHDSLFTDKEDWQWHRNTNFEFFLKEAGHVQHWVSLANGGSASSNVTMYSIKTTANGDTTPKHTTIIEVFVANEQLPANSVKEGVIRAGVAWKTPGDQINNGGANAVDEWWCPKYRPDVAEKHYVTADGIFADTEFTFDVDTAEELIDYIKMVNAGTENHNNFTRNLTLNITADIDLTGYEWTPITRWVGIINGNGHTLSGIKFVTDGNNAHYGLLVGDIGNNNANGSVYDVHIADSLIVAKNAGDDVGGIAGMVDRGRIVDCSVDNVTVIGGKWAGGIVGRACWGTEGDNVIVRNCAVTNSTVIGNECVGAIVGTNDNATLDLGDYVVENVYVKGSETAKIGEVVGAWADGKQHIIGENASATKVTTLNDKTAKIVSGAENAWDAAAPTTLTIVTNGTDNSLYAVKVNGKTVKASNYTAVEADGKLTITLKNSYLEKLPNGEHKVEIGSYEGDLEASFTVANASEDNVQTGDMALVIVLVSILSLGVAIVVSKKRQSAK